VREWKEPLLIEEQWRVSSLSNKLTCRRNGKWLNCVIYERRPKIHHYRGMRRWACFYVLMCILPKRRALRDHAPGPIIAAVTPSAARTIEIHGSLAWVIVTHRFDHGGKRSDDRGPKANKEKYPGAGSK
jgi:hypothetical protein